MNQDTHVIAEQLQVTPAQTESQPGHKQYVELAVSARFSDQEHAIFDALDMGADLGTAFSTSRASLQQRLDDATLFFQELMESLESLGAVAEQHGVNTLSDLMYLQQAILKDTFVEVWPGETKIGAVLQALPSGKRWLKYTDLAAEWKQHCVRVDSPSTHR